MKEGAHLPDGWTTCRLGDVVDYGATTKAEPDEIADDDWLLELEDIEKDTSRVLQRLTFGERQSKSTKNRFQRGDVLYGKLRPYLNKVVQADADGVCTTEIIPLRAPASLDPRYLFHWLKHPQFTEYVNAASHGLNMPRLGTKAGRQAPFILAPLAEQQRIADKLDALLARVDACRDRLDRLPGLLKRFRQAVCNAAATRGGLSFDQRVDDEPGSSWRIATLGDAALEVRNGLAPKPSPTPPGVKILRISAVRPLGLDLDDHRFLQLDDETSTAYELREDDLLFTRYNGTLEFVGVCARVPAIQERYVYPDKLIRVRLDRGIAHPAFVELVFATDKVRRQIEAVVKSSAGQKGISGADLRRVEFPLPPLDEQAEIVRRVEALFALADRLEVRLQAARAQVERLTPALLAKAFRGELLPQDARDEPAAALLARLGQLDPA